MVRTNRIARQQVSGAVAGKKEAPAKAVVTPGPMPIQQLLEGMVLAFNPEEGGDLTAKIQFDVTDSSPSVASYHLTIANGACEFHKGVAADPTLTIKTPADVWTKVSQREISGQDALMQGLYMANGDLNLLLRMESLFRPMEEVSFTASDQRPAGPIGLRGMQWMTVSFISWTIYWIASSIPSVPAWLEVGVPLVLAASLVVYRQVCNRSTLMDWGALLFFSVVAPLTLAEVPNVVAWGSVYANLLIALVWFGTVAFGNTPVTMEYSKWGYNRLLWRHSLFIYVNQLLTTMWGGIFIAGALLGIAAVIAMNASLEGPSIVLQVMRYLILIPPARFTARYPSHAVANPPRNISEIQRSLRVLSIIGLVATTVIAILLMAFGQ
jgi:hypothetical protein